MLRKIAQSSRFLQNLVIHLISSIHPSIEHNLEKIGVLKKAMFHCELEQMPGSYFEFGTYEGTSLYAALKIHGRLPSKIQRNFYGFDVFGEGPRYSDEKDRHPFFREGEFKTVYPKVAKRFRKYKNVHLIKGYFEETIAGKTPSQIGISDPCAILFIDCDLMNPAWLALNFIKPALQQGTIIVLDDYWAYRGAPDRGTCGAFNRFLKENPHITVRPYYTYGYGGNSFLVTQIST